MNTLTVVNGDLLIKKITCDELISLQRQYESTIIDYSFTVEDDIIISFYETVKENDKVFLLLNDNTIDYPDEEKVISNLSYFGVKDYREVSEWFLYAPTMVKSTVDVDDTRTHFISCFGHEEYAQNVVYTHVVYRDEGWIINTIISHLRIQIIDEIINDLQ